MAKSFDDAKPVSDNRWDESINMLQKPTNPNEVMQLRIYGGLHSFGQHWVLLDPTADAGKAFPRDCTNYNPETERPDLDHGCPNCALDTQFKARKVTKRYLMNNIDCELRGIPGKDPVVVSMLPPTFVQEILNLKRFNKGPGGVKFHVNHEDHGRDLFISYDSNAKGGKQWTVQASEPAYPLSAEDRALKFYNLEDAYFDFKGDTDESKAFIDDYNADTTRSLVRLGYIEEAGSAAAGGSYVPQGVPPGAAPPPLASVTQEEVPVPAAAAAPVAQNNVVPPNTATTPVAAVAAAPPPAAAPVAAAPVAAAPVAAAAAPVAAAPVAAAPVAAAPVAAAPVAAAPVALPVVSGKDPRCVHTSPDYDFGNFQGDTECMGCPARQPCITES